MEHDFHSELHNTEVISASLALTVMHIFIRVPLTPDAGLVVCGRAATGLHAQRVLCLGLNALLSLF